MTHATRNRIVKFVVLVTCLTLCLAVPRVKAVPAAPVDAEFTQPDGTTFVGRLKGDESFSWHETSAGYSIQKDDDGTWRYATPLAGGAGFVPVAGGEVGKVDPEALGLTKHMVPSREAILASVRAGMSGSIGVAVPSAELEHDEVTADPDGPQPVVAQGTIKNIVILAAFSDQWDSGNGTVASGYGLAASKYEPLFNEVGYTTQSAVGSVRDYYDEVSYGDVTMESIIFGWVELPGTMASYGASGTGYNDLDPRQMVVDALAAADAAGYDFSQGDGDGDGWVDCLTIIHSGHDEAYSGNSSNNIWSHKWEISSAKTYDGVKMKRYHTEPALRNADSNTTLITNIGVICHELGHFFGLPDLYDYSNQSQGLGDWSVMAGGSWGVGFAPERPVHFDAWSKTMLGWVRPVEIHSGDDWSLGKVETNRDIHLIRDGMNDDEYFLVENRQATGFDSDIGSAAGIIIYHVDDGSTNNALYNSASYPSGNDHPRVKIEEADGDNSLGGSVTALESGDSWRSNNGISGGFDDVTGKTTSNAMIYQSGNLYSRSNSSSSYTYNALSGFSSSGSTMTYDARTLVPGSIADATSTTGSYTLSWTASNGASKYTVQEGEAVTNTSFSDSCDTLDELHANWYVLGDVRLATESQSGAAGYVMEYLNTSTSTFLSPVQQIVQKDSFTVTSSTKLTFYIKGGLTSASGNLRVQISDDDGSSWSTLATYTGAITSFTKKTISSSTITSAVSAGSEAIIRFLFNAEQASGYSYYPYYGFAIDTIELTGIEQAGFDNWTTLTSVATGTAYSVSGKSNGTYGYRVRGYSNSAWQDYSDEGTVTVAIPTGNLTVTLNPSDARTAGAQWSIDGGTTWYDSATTVSDLEVGSYTITCKDVDGWDTPADSSVTVSDGTTKSKTLTYVQQTGSLTVTLSPADAVTAGAQWSIDGGSTWKDSGTTLTGQAVGDYTVTFKTVTGWTAPADLTATVTDGGSTSKSATYTEQVGSLTVTISPDDAVSDGAKWSIDDGSTWIASGSTLTDLAIGDYTITFRTRTGWDTPADISATVTDGATTSQTATYVQQLGSITVTLSPAEAIAAGAKWRPAYGVTEGDPDTWYDSGATVSDLPVGDYYIYFKTVTGWDSPSYIYTTVTQNATTSEAGTYVQQTGTLKVTISPSAASTAGALWSIDGGESTHGSSEYVELPVGDYTITFTGVDGYDTPADIETSVSDDKTTFEVGYYVEYVGSLTVTISPEDAVTDGAKWSIDGGTTWIDSAATVTDLLLGDYTVTFKSVTGWDSPADITTTITKDTESTETGTYVQQVGGVVAIISPAAARTAGAQWSVDVGTTWNDSASPVYDLPIGDYTMTFKDVSGWRTPANKTVTVTKENLTNYSVIYFEEVAYLTVSIQPDEAVDSGAQWSVDDGATWYDSDYTPDLSPGTYTITYKDVTGWTTPADESVTLVDDDDVYTTATYVEQFGDLTVTIEPQGARDAGAKWSADGGDTWYESGETITDTRAGSYTITFFDVAGWTTPSDIIATVIDGQTTSETATYIEQLGDLTVTISPADAVTAGAQWSIDSGTTWNDSDATLSDLSVGDYTVTFKSVDGWNAPSDITATVADGQTTSETGTYVLQVGSLTVTISPADAVTEGAQWSIDAGTTWNDSAATLTYLPVGDYTITYKTLTGWTSPVDEVVTITDGGSTSTTATYTEQVGGLSVIINPSGARSAGAKWSLDDGTTWYSSEEILEGLRVGTYTITFKDVNGWASPADETATVIDNATFYTTVTYSQQFGDLTVTISPEDAVTAGAQWSINGGTTWNDSGATLSDIGIGDYTITFKSVDGWNAPSDITTTVADSETTSETGVYEQQLGNLTVTLSPAGAVTNGAQWSIDGGTTWNDSGATVADLPVGDYTVTFSDVTAYNAPADITATVTDGATTSETGTYVAQVGSMTITLGPDDAITAGAKWTYNISTSSIVQITYYDSGATVSDLPVGDYTVSFKTVTGWDTPADITVTVTDATTATGTGTYVQQVGSLTVTLSPADAITDGAQWSIDGGSTWNDSGATVSDLPIGDYTVTFMDVTGWDTPADITATITKDTETTESAAYVQQVGSLTVTLSPADAITDGAAWSVDGGTTWIDSGVALADLPIGDYTVTFAAVTGWDTPADITATITKDTTTSESATYVQQLGSLTVTLSPADAITDGAQWSIDGGSTFYDSATTVSDLPIGDYSLSFKSLAGWTTPGSQTVTIAKDTETTATGVYVGESGTLTVSLLPTIAGTAGAQWSIDSGSTWNDSGASLSVGTGSYTVTFSGVASWLAPVAMSTTVTKDTTTSETGVYLPLKGDFTGDGQSDVIAQTGDGSVRIFEAEISYFLKPGDSAAGEVTALTNFSNSTDLDLPALSSYTICGVGDFNADDRMDLVVQTSTGAVKLLLQDSGGNYDTDSAWIYSSALSGWTVAAVVDLDGDGDPDLVLQSSTGIIAAWFIEDQAMVSSSFVYSAALPTWSVCAGYDLDGDGDGDLVLQDSDGQVAFWYLANGVLESGVLVDGNVDADWEVCGVYGVYNSSTIVNLLEQNTSTRQIRYHRILSEAWSTADVFPDTLGYGTTVVGVSTSGEAGGGSILLADASCDVTVLKDTTSYEVRSPAAGIQGVTSTSTSSFTLPSTDSRKLIGTADWDDNGSEDILWQDSDGRIGITWMTTGSPTGSAWVSSSTSGLTAVGVGDLDLDGVEDIIFRSSTGTITVQYLAYNSDTVSFGSSATIIEGLSDWSVAAVGQLGETSSSADLILQASTGAVAYWEMSNTSIANSGFLFSGALSGWTARTLVDIGGTSGGAPDGQQDLILESTDGTVAAWFLSNSGSTVSIGGSAFISVDLGTMIIVGSGVVSGGSQSDLLLQDADGAATFKVQTFNEQTASEAANVTLPALSADERTVLGSGDVDGDGNLDLIWTTGSLQVGVCFLDGSGNSAGTAWMNSTAYSGWDAVGVSDFDSDGHPDILIRDSSGTIALWTFEGVTLTGGVFLSGAIGTWEPVGTGDLDADGNMDLLLQDSSTGDLVVWYFTDLTFTGTGEYLLTDLEGYEVIGVGDFDGDRVYDLILEDTTNGTVWIRPLDSGRNQLTLPSNYWACPL